MADATETAPAAASKKSGGVIGMLVNGIGIFALTLGAVVAGGYVNGMLHPTPDFKLGADGKSFTAVKANAAGGDNGKEAAAKAEIYYAIDPPLVVNFEDGAAVRFLQISMEAMSKDQKAIDAVTKNVPLIRNNLLLLMGNRDFKSLMSREGKEKLRTEALAEIRSIAKKEGSPEVDDILFTSFVVQ
jgi:flagellar FliL protein